MQAIGQPFADAAPAASSGADASLSAPNQANSSSDATTQPSTTTQEGKSMQATQVSMPTNAQAPAAQPQLTIPPEVINQSMQAIQQQSQVAPGKDFQSGYYGTATPQPCTPDVPVPLPTPQALAAQP